MDARTGYALDGAAVIAAGVSIVASAVAAPAPEKTPRAPAFAGLSETVAMTPGSGPKKNRSHGSPDPRD